MISLEEFIEKHREGVITTRRDITDNTNTNRTTNSRKQKWEEKTTPWAF